MIEWLRETGKICAVVVLSVFMLQQPFIMNWSKSSNTDFFNPSETLAWLAEHILDLEYASQAEFNAESLPMSEKYPEKQDAESENENIEKEKNDYNLHESSLDAIIRLSSMLSHFTHSPDFGRIVYRGKIPTPPPEA